MRASDFVVYIADPWRYGNLVVCDHTTDGKLVVQDSSGETHTLHPFDLELEEVWAQGQMQGALEAFRDAA